MATVVKKMMGGSVRRIGNDVLASPRAFSIGAPIEDHARTAMIGAAEDFPYAPGTLASPAGVRITIAARVCLPRSLESSTPAKAAAKEGGEGPQTRLIAFGKGSTGEAEPVGTRTLSLRQRSTRRSSLPRFKWWMTRRTPGPRSSAPESLPTPRLQSCRLPVKYVWATEEKKLLAVSRQVFGWAGLIFTPPKDPVFCGSIE
jgi:hypothetical protein